MFVFRSVLCLGILAFLQLMSWLMMRVFPDAVVLNTTALFGVIRAPAGVGLIVLLGLIAIIRLASAPMGQWAAFGVVLALAGGVSNILDRVIWGGAVDYIPLGTWSTFNLADIAIVVGAVLLITGDRLPAIKKRSRV